MKTRQPKKHIQPLISALITATTLSASAAAGTVEHRTTKTTIDGHLMDCYFHDGKGGFDNSMSTITVPIKALRTAEGALVVSNAANLLDHGSRKEDLNICSNGKLNVTVEQTLSTQQQLNEIGQCVETLTENVDAILENGALSRKLYGGGTTRFVRTVENGCL